MFNLRTFCFAVCLFLGMIAISPSVPSVPSAEIVSPLFQLDGTDFLQEADLRAAETYLPYILKYVDSDDPVIPLVLAVMKAESNFEIQAISHKGALGLMQIMPETALDHYRKSGMDVPLYKLKKNLVEQPELNIAIGVMHLKDLQERLEGIENPDKFRKLVIASYNAGIHRVKRAFNCKGFECYKYKANRYSNTYFKQSIKSLPSETILYLQNVEKYYEEYRKILADQKNSSAAAI